MTIRQVITMAQTGELANIAVKSNISAIVSFINLGMIELYKRFPIKVSEAIITLRDGKTLYSLDGSDADVDMEGEFMWLVAAYDELPEQSGAVVALVPINEEDNPLSLNTVGYNQVQIPLTLNGAYMSLIYVAAPPAIEYVESTDSFTIDGVVGTVIPLPPQMLEALLHYVGYRAHAAMDGNIQAENSTHYTRFENSCNRIEQRGMMTADDLSMQYRVKDKGFV